VVDASTAHAQQQYYGTTTLPALQQTTKLMLATSCTLATKAVLSVLEEKAGNPQWTTQHCNAAFRDANTYLPHN